LITPARPRTGNRAPGHGSPVRSRDGTSAVADPARRFGAIAAPSSSVNTLRQEFDASRY